MGGGGWYVWNKKGPADQGEKPAEAAKTEEPAPTAQPAAAATDAAAATPVSPAAVDSDAAALDAKFQKINMWNVVKREFPDWYGEQLREAAKLEAQHEPEINITKHLAEALVALRRQHANEALSASTDKLKDRSERLSQQPEDPGSA